MRGAAAVAEMAWYPRAACISTSLWCFAERSPGARPVRLWLKAAPAPARPSSLPAGCTPADRLARCARRRRACEYRWRAAGVLPPSCRCAPPPPFAAALRSRLRLELRCLLRHTPVLQSFCRHVLVAPRVRRLLGRRDGARDRPAAPRLAQRPLAGRPAHVCRPGGCRGRSRAAHHCALGAALAGRARQRPSPLNRHTQHAPAPAAAPSLPPDTHSLWRRCSCWRRCCGWTRAAQA